MTTDRLEFPGFSILAPDTWRNISESGDSTDQPFTIADPDKGVGAIQISPALYRNGTIPTPSRDDLLSMMLEFAESRELGRPLAVSTWSDETVVANGTFHTEDDFVAVWYISDGKNIALVTYVCAWESMDAEATERDLIVRSLRF